MDTTALKAFAQKARTDLMHQVGAQLKVVLALDSLARREQPQAILKLESEIEKKGKDVVIDEVAYTWFNRFCALRFMDVNHYNKVGVVSPGINQIQPEILSNAKSGVFDSSVVNERRRTRVLDLLAGRVQSRDAQGEAYRILLVSYCNALAKSMEFLFEKIADYTELLLPSDLLAVNSVLADCRTAMTEEACEDVEVIGWLYQFYISERKDEVFAGFKKGKKAGARDIPAATQLFTPHWIVQYLLDNSLGRLWMLNNPRSRLIEKMEYYIKPEQEEADYLRINKPEEIKVCDPACGSGHMLTYAFDLLYEIYEEQGYDPTQIPILILQNNLYGIEIDQRAGDLAAFALVMKARGKSRSFFAKEIKPNVMVLENIDIDEAELSEYIKHVGRDSFTLDVLTTIRQFKDAELFGSLIIPEEKNPRAFIEEFKLKQLKDEFFQVDVHDDIIKALEQAEYLSQQYHVVVANPPYMTSSNMNKKLSDWIKDNYADVKSDLFSSFIIRNTLLTLPKGQLGFMSPYVWMFISSYEKLRNHLIEQKTITSLIQLEYSGFDGATVPICTFTLENDHKNEYKGSFIRLSDFKGSENQAPRTLEAVRNPNCGWFYRVSADGFKKIPGSPIAYWVSENIRNHIILNKKLSFYGNAVKGLDTCDNDRFVRQWHEISRDKMSIKDSIIDKWYVYQKGGEYRKWYGNNNMVVNWEDSGNEIRSLKDSRGKIKSRPQNIRFYFQTGVTWSAIGSGKSSYRLLMDSIFGGGGNAFFPAENVEIFLAFLNSKIPAVFLQIYNATFNNLTGDLHNIPIIFSKKNDLKIIEKVIYISQLDWNSFETSWNFAYLPLLDNSYRCHTLSVTYASLRIQWNEMTLEMQRLEEENNRVFIEAYGLQDELTPDVPLEEITLTCNPKYRYRGNKSDEELEALLLADTMKEFISYAVGCMFGRYSLDKPGLILANQGETYEDYNRLVPESSFPADKNNAIPILDGDWFVDDIVSRFRRFLRVTFGDSHFEANLKFIEQALGKDIRQYFLKDFYNDHVQRYKKRPIYWMFSSPDGSFNVLIYMHRYTPDTVSIVRNEYLREYMSKLTGHIVNLQSQETNMSLTKGERIRALKEIDKIKKIYDGLEKYEQDVIFPLATQRIEIDLDDGVRVNYPKFGAALKKIAGLEAKDEE